MTPEQAANLVRKNYPDLDVYSFQEYRDLYVVGLQPPGVTGIDDERFVFDNFVIMSADDGSEIQTSIFELDGFFDEAKEIDVNSLNHSDDYLVHYGVMGMKWGVRRSSSNKTSYSTKRKAKKDAKEFARAKMFYGEGAGNRRKLIKATVNQRKKNLKGYSEEFEKHLSKQDMSKHASAAKRERAVKSTAKTAAKTGRGLVNAATGNIGKASAAAAALYVAGHVTGINKKIADHAKVTIENVRLYNEARQILKNRR